MSTLEKMHKQENNILSYIKENKDVSDTVLRKAFCNEDFDKSKLHEFIDSLTFEKKIKRMYTEESQVALYTVCE
ncbi:MAG: hypothetical protein KBB91_03015 [Candidatus Pacebacteria bacterium]|jgi:hypothetical protein|nr:hypothetical protein [Candidatus Paceibacterota bacterium]